jgi:hypothetical protein
MNGLSISCLLLHGRWLQLILTPCGDLFPNLTARGLWPPYAQTLNVCPENTVELQNHAIGATSCLFAEKCVAQTVS